MASQTYSTAYINIICNDNNNDLFFCVHSGFSDGPPPSNRRSCVCIYLLICLRVCGVLVGSLTECDNAIHTPQTHIPQKQHEHTHKMQCRIETYIYIDRATSKHTVLAFAHIRIYYNTSPVFNVWFRRCALYAGTLRTLSTAESDSNIQPLVYATVVVYIVHECAHACSRRRRQQHTAQCVCNAITHFRLYVYSPNDAASRCRHRRGARYCLNLDEFHF